MDAGVVDEASDRTDFRAYPTNQSRGIVQVRYVVHHITCPRPDFLDGRIQFRFPAAHQDDAGAGRRHRMGNGQADTRSTPGDDRDLALKRKDCRKKRAAHFMPTDFIADFI